jgi:uncharacterized protein (DUF1778 family)
MRQAERKPVGVRIRLKVSMDTKELVERAAIASGQSLTDFAVATLLQSATEVLERQERTRLSDRDREAFLALLDSRAEPNAALKGTAKRYKKQHC